MKRVIELVAVVMSVAAVVGCGGKQGTTSSLDPTSQPAVWQDGIYVAAYDGADSNEGSAISPMRSINAAIEKARITGKHDVWIYGGGFNAGYAEVVVLQAGIDLHGSICKTDFPPAESDPAACTSSIVGGSPSMVAIDVRDNTVVENLEIVGLPGVQSGGPNDGFFAVDGIGCVGRGITNGRLPSCERPTDKDGRMTPFSSVGVALSRSNAVFFRNVKVIANEGARGLDGVDGQDGVNGVTPLAGLPAGDMPFKAGAGAKPRAPEACPESIGGKGGQGGSFRWTGAIAFSETTCLSKADCAAFFSANAVNGGAGGADSLLGALSYANATVYSGRQAGLPGMAGGLGISGDEGEIGPSGSNLLDLVSLSASEGELGDDGFAGHGGSGGAGGNPATRKIYEKRMSSSGNSTTLFGIAGAAFAGSQTSTYESEKGELAGAGGGAGGSGGCGGFGGHGGQGGASSVGVYLNDSTLSFDDSAVLTGAGGNGGFGGAGGIGGLGADGSAGGVNQSVDSLTVAGTLDVAANGGMFQLSTSQSYSMAYEKAYSKAINGAGGKGGHGGTGGRGGRGGAGAGGSSIGVASKGASTVLGTVSYELGAAGVAGDENGEAGRVIEILSL